MKNFEDNCRNRTPVRIAWESAKANWLPMIVLWIVAVGLVVGYYNLPWVEWAMRPIFDFQASGGWVAAVVNRVVFCGMLPGVSMIAVKSIRPVHPWATILANCIWMGAWGVASNAFFTLQAHIFGTGHDIQTLVAKVFVDKCIWSAMLCVPLYSLFFYWEGRNFSFSRCRAEWPQRYLRQIYLPVLMADFLVWVPVQFVVYMFPLPLQIQLVGLAGAFYSLVGLASGAMLARKGSRSSKEQLQ